MATAEPSAPRPHNRPCFHCGLPGHKVRDCPSSLSSQPQSKAGEEAFQAYLFRRRQLADIREKEQLESEDRLGCWEEEGSGGTTTNSRNNKNEMDHFVRVVEWMRETGGEQNNGNVLINIRDPIAVLRSEAEAAPPNPTQRWHDLHNARRNDFYHSYRNSFHHVISLIRNRLALELGVTESDERSSMWRTELTRAVKDGRPADFSAEVNRSGEGKDDGGGGRCLKVYAVAKLSARCRKLHHLVFNDNPFSAKARSMLLPVPIAVDAESPSPLRVVSLGGGPGYDHVALCLAARFLHQVNPCQEEFRPRPISTRVFDLYNEDWTPVLTVLGECCDYGMENVEGELCKNSNSGRNMTMSHADIRLSLDEPIHSDLAQAVELADIICVQFVLHENATFLTSEDGKRIAGAIGDSFQRAAIGSLMFCTDSVNTLWPALKATAAECGWRSCGNEELNMERSPLGAKSFVMLERIEMV